MNNLINNWFIPVECGIFAVIGTWMVKRDIQKLKKSWKDALKRKD